MTIIWFDIGLIYSLLTAKCMNLSLLIDNSTYFKDIIQYYFCQLSLEISQVTIYFSIQIHLIEVSAEQRFVVKGNIRR